MIQRRPGLAVGENAAVGQKRFELGEVECHWAPRAARRSRWSPWLVHLAATGQFKVSDVTREWGFLKLSTTILCLMLVWLMRQVRSPRLRPPGEQLRGLRREVPAAAGGGGDAALVPARVALVPLGTGTGCLMELLCSAGPAGPLEG